MRTRYYYPFISIKSLLNLKLDPLDFRIEKQQLKWRVNHVHQNDCHGSSYSLIVGASACLFSRQITNATNNAWITDRGRQIPDQEDKYRRRCHDNSAQR